MENSGHNFGGNIDTDHSLAQKTGLRCRLDGGRDRPLHQLARPERQQTDNDA